jgi:predicted nucleic acid-binding protein
MVSMYLADTHTPEVVRRMTQRPRIWLTPFHESEIMHAMGQQVFRGRTLIEQSEQMQKHFLEDCESGVWVLSGFPESALQRAAALGRTYAPKLGARTLDSIHVACALELGAQQFWTFDERQAKLAKAAGLKVS